jgi:HrpA-like RNA helicase
MVYLIKFYILFSGVPDYMKTTVEMVLQIHNSEPPGDILAFLTVY